VALASTMVRRKVARNWRRHRRQQRIELPGDDQDSLVDVLNDLSSPDANPGDAAQYQDEMTRLCESLNDSERQMLRMRLDGYASHEVAQALGIHPVALRVRWTRLRQRLQTAGVLADLV